ncbi:methyltransferase [Halomicrococcus sp. NG-SE-24]|uniref:methyltransferase n=1 Tax=Halomicrococcus sp. NG-SE-24 TaxID=3436928 RepID=UPI003D95A783
MSTAWTREMLAGYDWSDVSHVCDVGGGHGHLLCSLLDEHPHLEGIVLERPDVLEEENRLWALEMGVEDRCSYVTGDFFEAVPAADVYHQTYE